MPSSSLASFLPLLAALPLFLLDEPFLFLAPELAGSLLAAGTPFLNANTPWRTKETL